jgi:hypothetical protein
LVEATYGKLPLHFEANQGQSDDQVQFLARGSGYTLFLTATEAVFTLRPPAQDSLTSLEGKRAQEQGNNQARPEPAVVRMQLVGANPHPQVTGLEALPGKSNYFFGRDPTHWHTDIPTYGRVKYENVYSGVDLVYYGNQQQLEYDFVVAPGTDPTAIRLAFAGPAGTDVGSVPFIEEATGDLMLHTAGGDLRFHQPRIYQESNGGKQPVAGRYVLLDSAAPNSEPRTRHIGFEVAAYDTSKSLIIDPVLVYSTYLGGSGDDVGVAIAVDSTGNAYVTGSTGSPDFPTTAGAFRPESSSGIFVSKLNPAGSAFVYSTYVDDSSTGSSNGIAVDGLGNAYVTGHTNSTDFPVTDTAFQRNCKTNSNGNCSDSFVVKLNPVGSALVYSTYLGGSENDFVRGIAVDSLGNAYVTGFTASLDFPTKNPLQASLKGPGADAFVTKIDPTGATLVYSTYLGGVAVPSFAHDEGTGIAVDSLGNAYVTGFTSSTDFPTTDGAFQTGCRSFDPAFCNQAFVAKFNPTGSALIYSTYLGGRGSNAGEDIAVDATGNAYVVGFTNASDFPTTNGAFQTTPRLSQGESFVTKLNPTGSALVYSTYLGGSNGVDGMRIATDASGNAYVAGSIVSSSLFRVCEGGSPGIIRFPCYIFTPSVVKVGTTGTAVIYSISLSGSDIRLDSALDIAVDAFGNAYVVGGTNSSDLPITRGALQPVLSGVSDAFVVKIDDQPAGIITNFESPGNGPVSGITVIRGWAFATEVETSVSSVELFIDGQSAGEITCCSPRGDVQAAFPQFHADNTFNSGWGTVFNWGTVSAGTHTLRLFIRSTAGELFVTDTRTVTVVKPGDSEFLDQFDLSQATVSIQEEDLIVNDILVRDKASQQQKRINTRFRWFENAQALMMVETATGAEVSSLRSFFASFFGWFKGGPALANAQSLSQVAHSLESPEPEQVVSGIGVVRGWAFSEAQDSTPLLGLMIDGQWSGRLPCCSKRADVSTAFPDQPTALHSGWGTVLNYGLLGAGHHTIGVAAGYFGAISTLDAHAVTAIRLGGFEFLDQFDLSQATAQVVQVHLGAQPNGAEIRLTGVQVRDKATQQTKVIDVSLRWFESAQGLGISAVSN